MVLWVCEQGRYLSSLLSGLRDKSSDKTEFRRCANLLGEYLLMEAIDRGFLPFRDNVQLVTPTGAVVADGVKYNHDSRVCVVPILRAGLTFLDAVFRIVPGAVDVGHLVIQRNEETALPILLLDKIPIDVKQYERVVVLDPMLATGGSVVAAIDVLLGKGVREEQIVLVHALAAPEGVAAVESKFPKINGVIGVVDSHLNEKKYIIPGLGDFGDRYY